ncbi:MAG TPA: hypothetical protein VF803_02195 [Candidatus Paceibacterota bacterium]
MTSTSLKKYSEKIKLELTPHEHALFESLDTPHKIQDYLDALPMNFEQTARSPRFVIRRQTAQCLEGAILAAALRAFHGHEPLLLDLQAIAEDDDHVVALFQERGYWGAISQTNHAVLGWRDPIYATVRELAMSYVHEYFMRDGRNSMTAFSAKPFDLRQYDPQDWVASRRELWWLANDLDEARHTPAVPRHLERNNLRLASRVARKAAWGHAKWKAHKK